MRLSLSSPRFHFLVAGALALFGSAGHADPAFSKDTLQRLLEAELYVSRGNPAAAMPDYQAAAALTQDPGVTDRALEIANFLQDSPTALPLAERMTRLKPDEPRYYYQTAFHAMKATDYEKAIQAIDRLLALDPAAELESLFLGANPPSSTGRQNLLDALPALEKQHPDNGQLLFAHALLLGDSGKTAEGLEMVRRARALNPDGIQPILLEARFLSAGKQLQPAMDLLRGAIDRHPDNRALNVNYVKLMIRAERLLAAENRLEQLLATFPNDEEMLRMHGLLAYNSRHDAAARASFEKLVMMGSNEPEAHYYLGALAKRNDNLPLAESHFQDVDDGPQFAAAQSELAVLRTDSGRLGEARQQLAAARQSHPAAETVLYNIEADLLNRHDQPQAALDLLEEAIRRHPDDNLLLFNRSMVLVKLNNLKRFEEDMQDLLKRDPDNPVYLNAFGYTLVDMTRRYGEAESYLRRAYQMKPDDPAIIDSMGWLFYRLGDISGALEYIQKAYNSSSDEEIGLHLAEVLWASKRKDDARKVWAELIRRNPDSKAVPQQRALIEQKP